MIIVCGGRGGCDLPSDVYFAFRMDILSATDFVVLHSFAWQKAKLFLQKLFKILNINYNINVFTGLHITNQPGISLPGRGRVCTQQDSVRFG